MSEEVQWDRKREVERFRRELEDIPDPSCGRIQELKDKIRNKKLFTKEAIQDTATRIIARFSGRE